MKKYFLHNGTEQSGPFDLNDLKNKNIERDTAIWYEGLDKWTTAGAIPELDSLFATSTPPPFSEKKTVEPPPMQSNDSSAKGKQAPAKKKSKVGLWIFVVVVIVLLGLGALMVVNNPNAIPGVKLEINTPKPLVVTSRADRSNSTLFKGRVTVYSSVQNQGGAGNVLVSFFVYQDGNKFERSKQVYMQANESQDLEVTFDEVRRLGGDITFEVDAH